MALYEFSCSHCESEFGVAIEKEMDPTDFFCVECAGSDLVLTGFYDDEISRRVSRLTNDVSELQQRVKGLVGDDAETDGS